MVFQNIFKNFFGMITLDEKSFRAAGKPDFLIAVVNFLIAGLALGLGTFFLTLDPLELMGTVILVPILGILSLFISVLIFWVIAKMFGGKAGYMAHYTGASYFSLWAIPSIIPFIGPIITMIGGFWAIIMHVFLIKEIHKLSVGKSVAAVLIPYAILFVIVSMIMFIAVMVLGLAIFGGVEDFSMLGV